MVCKSATSKQNKEESALPFLKAINLLSGWASRQVIVAAVTGPTSPNPLTTKGQRDADGVRPEPPREGNRFRSCSLITRSFLVPVCKGGVCLDRDSI